MFTITISVSVLAADWGYSWGLGEDDDDQREPRSCHRLYGDSIEDLPRPISVSEEGGEAKPQQLTSTLNGPLDIGYIGLSDEAQKMQSQARERRAAVRRERIADAGSLGLLEAASVRSAAKSKSATPRNLQSRQAYQDVFRRGHTPEKHAQMMQLCASARREHMTDVDSLGLLEAATAGAAAKSRTFILHGHQSLQGTQECSRHQKKKLAIGYGWYMIRTPSNTRLSKVQGPDGTPWSWDPCGTMVSMPRTPVEGVKKADLDHHKPKLDRITRDAMKGRMDPKQGTKDVSDPSESRLADGSKKPRHWRQRIETVYDLFDTLRHRDDEQDAEELRAVDSVPGSDRKSADSKSSGDWQGPMGGVDDAGSPIPNDR